LKSSVQIVFNEESSEEGQGELMLMMSLKGESGGARSALFL
jgi:hypothetical protein